MGALVAEKMLRLSLFSGAPLSFLRRLKFPAEFPARSAPSGAPPPAYRSAPFPRYFFIIAVLLCRFVLLVAPSWRKVRFAFLLAPAPPLAPRSAVLPLGAFLRAGSRRGGLSLRSLVATAPALALSCRSAPAFVLRRLRAPCLPVARRS